MKPREVVLQSGAGPALAEGQPAELRDAALDPSRRSGYVGADEAAVYLGFPSTKAFRTWLLRNPTRLRTFRLGRELRFRPRDLEECPQEQGQAVSPFKARHFSSHRRGRA